MLTRRGLFKAVAGAAVATPVVASVPRPVVDGTAKALDEIGDQPPIRAAFKGTYVRVKCEPGLAIGDAVYVNNRGVASKCRSAEDVILGFYSGGDIVSVSSF